MPTAELRIKLSVAIMQPPFERRFGCFFCMFTAFTSKVLYLDNTQDTTDVQYCVCL